MQQRPAHAMPPQPAHAVLLRVLRVFFAAAWVASPVTADPPGVLRLDPTRGWTATEAFSPQSAALTEARRLLADGLAAQSKRAVDKLLADPATAETVPLPAVLLLLGDAQLAMGHEYEALRAYEQIALEHAESPEFQTALLRELQIAQRYSDGLKLKDFFGLRTQGADEVGAELFIRIQERMPGSALAERAAIALGAHYYNRHEMDLAYDSYDLYLENFPDGPNAALAMRRRIFANIGQFKGPRYNGARLLEALLQVEEFVERFPADARRYGVDASLEGRLDESLAAQRLEAALWRSVRGDAASASLMLERLIDAHPRSAAAEEARNALEATPPIAPATAPLSGNPEAAPW